MNKKLLIFIATIVVIAIAAYFVFKSDDTTPPQINPAFTGYVSSFTSGVISKEAEIIVRLREDVDELKRTEDVAADLFDFDPNIEGEAYWTDNRTVAFKPTEKLP